MQAAVRRLTSNACRRFRSGLFPPAGSAGNSVAKHAGRPESRGPPSIWRPRTKASQAVHTGLMAGGCPPIWDPGVPQACTPNLHPFSHTFTAS
jgi:hypothetical protein